MFGTFLRSDWTGWNLLKALSLLSRILGNLVATWNHHETSSSFTISARTNTLSLTEFYSRSTWVLSDVCVNMLEPFRSSIVNLLCFNDAR